MKFSPRPKAAASLCAALCLFSMYLAAFSGGKNRNESGAESFLVVQRHFGIDAATMEKTAAIPLEDALSRIRGLKSLSSTSENGSSRVYAVFSGNDSSRAGAVREAAYATYRSLPPSAQRPEISSAGEDRIPVWSAAAALKNSGDKKALGILLEKTVKPALEALPGVSEVQVAGASLAEIVVACDPEKTAAAGIGIADVAASLASSDGFFSGGAVCEAGAAKREIPLVFDGRFASIEEMKEAPIKTRNGFVPLSEIATVTESEKEPESLSRVNGRETAVVAVLASGGESKSGRLSALIKNEIEHFGELDFTVLSDRGAEELAARKSVLTAALEGALAVALITAFLCWGKTCAPFFSACVLSVPAIVLFSAGLLSAAGAALGNLALAGLAAGSGSAIDAVLISADSFAQAPSPDQGLKSLRFPLVSGAATTVIALIPLALDRSGSGLRASALAVGAVNVVSLALALLVLPHFVGEISHKGTKAQRGLRSGKVQFFQDRIMFVIERYINFCVRHPIIVVLFCAGFTLGGGLAVLARGVETGSAPSNNSVYARIEFESGLLMEEADRRLAAWGAPFAEIEGVESMQTSAQVGSGTALLSFNPKKLSPRDARELVRSRPIPGGFAYLGEPHSKEHRFRITVYGDDEKKCRALAREAGGICAALPHLRETVLNFKEGSPAFRGRPRRDALALSGIQFSQAGQTLRYAVFAPVAYKRFDGGGSIQPETDVRFLWRQTAGAGLPAASKTEVLKTVVGSPRAESLFDFTEEAGVSSIERRGRSRCASLTVTAEIADPFKARKTIMPALSSLALPPGYRIEFDSDAIEAARAVGASAALLILALAFCYIALAVFSESFSFPLAVLAVVPPSLALPALWIFASGGSFSAAQAAAFVAASGMAVNAAALVGGELRGARDIGVAVRKKIPVLAATTVTTVAGVLPFLWRPSAASGAAGALSLVAALGVAASAFFSCTLLPALITLCGAFRYTKACELE